MLAARRDASPPPQGAHGRARRPGRWSAVQVAVLLLFPALVALSDVSEADAASVPGRFAWVERTDRGDRFRLVLRSSGGDVVVAPHTYGRPALSPDGTRLAWTAPQTDGSDGRWALWVMRLDGSDRRQLTAPAIGDFHPAWNPDSTSLVVSRYERGSLAASCCTLWLVAADGSGERRLDAATSATHPDFAPDGATVAYTAPDGIRLVNVHDGGTRLLASGRLSWPSFSPDGTRVAMARYTGPDSGTVSWVPTAGGGVTDTSAGSGGGFSESVHWVDDATVMHLQARGRGENERTWAEVRTTSLSGGSSHVLSTGGPLFYLAWTPGPSCPTVPVVPQQPADRPAIARFGGFYLRASLSSGAADACFPYGNDVGDVAVTGDWDGDGRRSPGVFRSGAWHLRADNNAGSAVTTIGFGSPGDVPVVGDWDGDGTDTVGVFRGGRWYLRNSNTSGVADSSHGFGVPGDTPVAGDWNGDGRDTLGVVRSAQWYLSDTLDRGTAEHVFGYGVPGDVPVVGDWDGDGTTTQGVFRNGAWYLADRFASGVAERSFLFGQRADLPLVWR